MTLDASGSVVEPGRTVVRIAWDTGDGGALEGATVAYVYKAPGAYRATATVTDDAGGVGTASVDVVVRGVEAAVRPQRLTAGERVTVSGRVVPAAAGVEVRLQQRRGGDWQALGGGTTQADGTFALAGALVAGGPLRVVALAPDAVERGAPGRGRRRGSRCGPPARRPSSAARVTRSRAPGARRRPGHR